MIQKAGMAHAKTMRVFWSQAGDQFEIEESLRLQFGWPAVVGIRLDKNVYAIHKGSYNQDNLQSFLSSIVTGRTSVDPLPKEPLNWKTVNEAWKPTKKDEL
eukprot:Trichotokara_eunicae@DN5679_c0_g1_i1.p2